MYYDIYDIRTPHLTLTVGCKGKIQIVCCTIVCYTNWFTVVFTDRV